MKLSRFSIWSLAILLLCCDEIGVCFACPGGTVGKQEAITWDDLLVTRGGMAKKANQDHDRVIVVDPNGGGDATAVRAAIQMVPDNNTQRVKIHILPGVYEEKIHIPRSKPHISLIGDRKYPRSTVITGHTKASDRNYMTGGKLGTVGSATISVEADFFCASGITFENTVVQPSHGEEGYQGVAMKLSGDKSVLYRVWIIGSQDTLLDWKGSHYFYKCVIQGATDFICGNARSLYKKCRISVVSPGYAIAAHHRQTANENTGFSFVNCTITGRDGTRPFLGRPWGDYATVIYSFCKFYIDIMSGGWNDWGAPSKQKTAMFGEYQCTTMGAWSNGSYRVPWSRNLNSADAEPFLGKSFIGGQQWLKL